MPQKRKYESSAALAEAIESYFKSISAEEEVVRTVFDGTDDSGNKKYHAEAVLNRNGESMRRIVWYTPPTIGGLCLYLGISRKTFSAYSARKAYAAAIAHARSVVMAYLEEKISDPDIKNVKGVSLAMETLLSVLEDEKRRAEPVAISTKECAELLREAAACGFFGEGCDG